LSVFIDRCWIKIILGSIVELVESFIMVVEPLDLAKYQRRYRISNKSINSAFWTVGSDIDGRRSSDGDPQTIRSRTEYINPMYELH